MPILTLKAGSESAKIRLKTDYCFRLSTICTRILQYTVDRIFNRLRGSLNVKIHNQNRKTKTKIGL